MSIVKENIKTTWNSANKKHLLKKGYIFTKFYEELEINNLDLQETSPLKVKCKCNSCNKIYFKQRRKIDDVNFTLCGSCNVKIQRDKKRKRCSCGQPLYRPGKYAKCKECRNELTQYDKNEFEILSDGSVKIFLVNKNNERVGETLIDLEDLERVLRYKWRLSTGNYVRGGKGNFDWLHRFIMNCPKDMEVDHIEHNTLDNRKHKLRICTHKENCNNRRRVS